MKKLSLLAVIALFSVISVHAQNPTDLIQFGLKGGMNFSSLSGDDIEDVSRRTGFHAGGLVEIPYSERFSVQAELLYSTQGAEAEYTWGKGILKLDYIQIPVLAKIYVAQGFNVQIGPQVGFRMNEEFELDSGSSEAETDLEIDENDIDVGIAAGLGYKFSSGFFIQARYTHGLMDALPDSDAKNSVIQAGIGYLF